MKLEEFQKDYFQTNLYEMSNYDASDTGLPGDVMLWVRTEPTVLPHVKYRIKVGSPQRGSAVFAIWGDEAKQVEGDWKVSGKELKKIKLLVRLTYNQLRGHIDGEISSGQLGRILDGIRKQVEKI